MRGRYWWWEGRGGEARRGEGVMIMKNDRAMGATVGRRGFRCRGAGEIDSGGLEREGLASAFSW